MDWPHPPGRFDVEDAQADPAHALFVRHHRLVLHVMHFLGRHTEPLAFEDVLQEGYLLLLEAARDYLRDRPDVPEVDYLANRIRWGLMALMRRKRPITVPHATPGDVAVRSESMRRNIAQAWSWEEEVDFDALASDGPEAAWVGTIDDPVSVAAERDERAAGERFLAGFLVSLPRRWRAVLEGRHGLAGGAPATLQAVAERLGVTRERTRQIESQVGRRLAQVLRAGTRWARAYPGLSRLGRTLRDDFAA